MEGDGLTPPEGGKEGGEANENDDVAGLDPKPWVGCCCACCYNYI